jgi:hypothetical protein
VLKQVNDYPMTDHEFLSLSGEVVMSMIQKAVRPKSKELFVEALRVRIPVRYPDNYRPDPMNFKILYQCCLVYRSNWLKNFDYMRYDNEKNVPECTDKVNGLIGLFLSGLDQYSYAMNTYQNRMDHPLKQTFKGVNGFDNFLAAFYHIMTEDFRNSETATALSSSINLKSTISKEPFHDRPAKVEPRADFKPRAFTSFQNKQKPGNRLSAMSAENYEYNDDETVYDYNPYDFQDESSQPDDVTVVSKNDNPVNGDKNTDQLHALTDDKPNCCFAKLFFNECPKLDKCNYDHSPEMLLKGLFYYANKLNHSAVKPRDFHIGSNPSPKQSSIPRIQPRPPQKFHNISESAAVEKKDD